MMAALPLSISQRGRTFSEPLQVRHVITVLPRTGRRAAALFLLAGTWPALRNGQHYAADSKCR